MKGANCSSSSFVTKAWWGSRLAAPCEAKVSCATWRCKQYSSRSRFISSGRNRARIKLADGKERAIQHRMATTIGLWTAGRLSEPDASTTIWRHGDYGASLMHGGALLDEQKRARPGQANRPWLHASSLRWTTTSPTGSPSAPPRLGFQARGLAQFYQLRDGTRPARGTGQ